MLRNRRLVDDRQVLAEVKNFIFLKLYCLIKIIKIKNKLKKNLIRKKLLMVT